LGSRIHGIYLLAHWVAGFTASFYWPMGSRILGTYLLIHGEGTRFARVSRFIYIYYETLPTILAFKKILPQKSKFSN
jgi:hypothetical protein